MDQDTRHWYLQQMGIPVWLPKDAASAETESVPAVDIATQGEQSVSVPQSADKLPRAKDSNPETLPQAEASKGQDAAAVAPPVSAPALWLVMPNVPAAQKAAAEDLLGKILAAVEVSTARCEMIWGLPEAMPTTAVQWVWCFGVQAPAGLTAKTLSLPSLAEMLNNVEAKRQAWGLLKSNMPFA